MHFGGQPVYLATLVIAINAPRDLGVSVIRDGLERATNAVERGH